jgi:DNA-binding response OmpR family regulator
VKLLIIEDDKDLSQNACAFLTAQHYLCETALDYRTALRKIEDNDYDCIIIDLTLPGGDGLQLLRELKRQNKTDGIIIVSARNELDDKILGLNLGADDYLTKPFHLAELSVRIAAIIRRKSLQGGSTIRFEEIEIDLAALTATVGKTVLSLTRKEYDLLLFFIINKNRVLSKNAIAAHLWGDDMGLADNHDFIYTHIKNLRKKLLGAGAADYIQSVYGMGYKFSLR